MRTCGFVLAMVMVAVPSLSYAQAQPRSAQPDVQAGTIDAEVRGDDPAAPTAPGRRSLMGMVMDVLIASAEQQSALEKTARQADAPHAAPPRPAMTGAATASLKADKSASPPDLAPREQIAVESAP